jgi:hypothetical protein
MNEHLRERIIRKLDTLSDERGYQILDYVEFLESRYAERQPSGATAFTRFTEAVEDRLRAGKVSATTIAEAMGLMNRAANVLNGALAAGRSVANDIVTATTTRTGSTAQAPGTASSGTPATGTPATGTPTAPTSPSNGASTSTTTASAEASSAAHDTKNPGSGEEKL